jgi:hypothetical protein
MFVCIYVRSNISCSDKHLASYCPVTHGNARRFLCSACDCCPSWTETGAGRWILLLAGHVSFQENSSSVSRLGTYVQEKVVRHTSRKYAGFCWCSIRWCRKDWSKHGQNNMLRYWRMQGSLSRNCFRAKTRFYNISNFQILSSSSGCINP